MADLKKSVKKGFIVFVLGGGVASVDKYFDISGMDPIEVMLLFLVVGVLKFGEDYIKHYRKEIKKLVEEDKDLGLKK